MAQEQVVEQPDPLGPDGGGRQLKAGQVRRSLDVIEEHLFRSGQFPRQPRMDGQQPINFIAPPSFQSHDAQL